MCQNLELTGLSQVKSTAYKEVTSLAYCEYSFIADYWPFCKEMSDLILRSVTFCTNA